MIYTEERGNVFEVDNKYYFAHCVSEDCAMARGIAVDFQKKFHIRKTLMDIGGKVGDTILVNRVFNLITKKVCYGKPTYKSLESTLLVLRDLCFIYNIKYLAMPKLACGLDKLQWSKVREMIKDIFKSSDINILVRTGE